MTVCDSQNLLCSFHLLGQNILLIPYEIGGHLMQRYLIGIVMIICGIILLFMAKGRSFLEIEQSLVIAYSFLVFGVIYIFYKMLRK